MATYPFMVQTAQNVLASICEEWRTLPYRWLRERDLQSELGGRLTQILRLQGLGDIKAPYKWAAAGFEGPQTLSRVSFEPYVGYVYREKESWCHPDIVIWGDPDGEVSGRNNSTGWPILWACELKYGSSDTGEWDVEKLRLLLEQEKIRFGCAVRVHFERKSDGVGIEWSQAGFKNKLWVCDVTAPARAEP